MRKREVPLFIEEFCADIALLDLWTMVEQACRKVMVVGVTRAKRASEMARVRAICDARRDDWRPLLRTMARASTLACAHVCAREHALIPRYDWRALYPCSSARGTIDDIWREVREYVRDAQWSEYARSAIWWARIVARTKGTDSFAFSFALLLLILARDPRNFTIAQLSAPIEYEPGCSREFVQMRALGAPLDVARDVICYAQQCTDMHLRGQAKRECIMTQTCYARILKRDIDIDACAI
jgi:hypothetical protein